jgi:osmotically inducible protein OsmC
METTIQSNKVLYTGKTHTTGGREHGTSRSSDGILDIKLSEPNTGGNGTNPEQLFAAAWSTCYESAMATAARRLKVTLPKETALDAEIDLCLENGAFYLQARLNVSLPGLDKEVARQILEAAHHICPYSKAIQGNVKIETNLV